MFSTCELLGFLLIFLPIADLASLSRPRFFTGLVLDAIADDMIGDSRKDISNEDRITSWNDLEDYYNYDNEYYEDFYGNKHRRNYRSKKTLSEDFEDPLGALLRRRESQNNFDGVEDDNDDEEDNVDSSEIEGEKYLEIRPQVAFRSRKKDTRQSSETSNEDDDEDGYEDEDEDEDDNEDERYEEKDEDEEEDSEENTASNKIKLNTNKKRKQNMKNSEENNDVNKEQPDAEGNIFIELKDDEKVEPIVVKIDSDKNKKKNKKKIIKNGQDDDENSNEEDNEDDEETQGNESEQEEDDDEKDDDQDEDEDDDDGSYEERSVKI